MTSLAWSSRENIEAALNYLDSVRGQYAGIKVDFEMLGDLVEFAPIRPADDDGSSWYCYVALTQRGAKAIADLRRLLN